MRNPTIAKRAIAAKMAAESLSEEMRVLYVAVTRARDRLIMTYMHQNLENKLRDIALRADFDGGDLLCRDVSCPGDWVLLTALYKMEAGALFALGGKPRETVMGKFPWKIAVDEAPETNTSSAGIEEIRAGMPESAPERLRAALEFQYPHLPATAASSKQTATGLKGRPKDEEAAEAAKEPKLIRRTWRKPGFRELKVSGKTYGSAMHAAMQFIRYENCATAEEVDQEIYRLVERDSSAKPRAPW